MIMLDIMLTSIYAVYPNQFFRKTIPLEFILLVIDRIKLIYSLKQGTKLVEWNTKKSAKLVFFGRPLQSYSWRLTDADAFYSFFVKMSSFLSWKCWSP